MKFEVLGEIQHVETIAVGTGVRVRALLNKAYGPGRWRKRKGFARVRLAGALFGELSYIGTRHTASAAATSRLRPTSISHETLD